LFISSLFSDHGSSEERLRVMRTVQGRIVQLAQHKYASNVVEKCVEKSGEADRRIVVLVSQRVRRQENSPGDRRIVLVSQRDRRQENSRLVESESKETGE
jgi:hypothetical protein